MKNNLESAQVKEVHQSSPLEVVAQYQIQKGYTFIKIRTFFMYLVQLLLRYLSLSVQNCGMYNGKH